MEPWARLEAQLCTDLSFSDQTAVERANAKQRVANVFQGWSRDPWWANEALLLPVADLVQDAIGERWFFAGYGFDAIARFEAAYESYERNFLQRYDALLLEEGAAGRAWRLGTIYASERCREVGFASGGYPIDDLTLQLYLTPSKRAAPRNPEDVSEAKATPDSAHRQGTKPQQGGAVGLRQTRSIDELTAILPSELAMPPERFVDKLLNEGVLALDRPPPVKVERTAVLTLMIIGDQDPAVRAVFEAGWWIAIEDNVRRLLAAGFDRVWMTSYRSGSTTAPEAAVNCVSRGQGISRPHPDPILGRMEFLEDFIATEAPMRAVEGRTSGELEELRAFMTALDGDCGLDDGLVSADFALAIVLGHPASGSDKRAGDTRQNGLVALGQEWMPDTSVVLVAKDEGAKITFQNNELAIAAPRDWKRTLTARAAVEDLVSASIAKWALDV